MTEFTVPGIKVARSSSLICGEWLCSLRHFSFLDILSTRLVKTRLVKTRLVKRISTEKQTDSALHDLLLPPVGEN